MTPLFLQSTESKTQKACPVLFSLQKRTFTYARNSEDNL